MDQVDEDLLNLIRVDVRHREVWVHLYARLDPVGHELVSEKQQGIVEQRGEVGRATLVLLLPRESQEILDDFRCPLRFLLNDRERLPQRRRNIGNFPQEIGEPHDGSERVVEVVGNAGDKLPDGRQFLRLDELVLQAPPLSLVVEEQDEGGSVCAGNRHSRNSIGLVAGTKIRLAAHSLLIQSPLQIGSPFGRNEGLPRPADQARRRGVHEIGKGAVGSPDPPSAVDDADGRRDGIHHLLPGSPSIVVEVHQPGTLECDAGLADQTVQQEQRGLVVPARNSPQRESAGHAALRRKPDDQPGPVAVGLGRDQAPLHQRLDSIGQYHRSLPLGDREQRATIGPAGRPQVGKILDFVTALKEHESDFGGGVTLLDVAHQKIDDRGPAKGPGQLTRERREVPHSGEGCSF